MKLHCAIAGGAQGEATRRLMLFLHGFPEFWTAWRKPMKPDLVCGEIERFVAAQSH